MTKIEDGGPAFPGEKETRFGQPNDCSEGMSLRDWFAGQAIMGSARTLGDIDVESAKDAARTLAIDAYTIADAMLSARNKEQGE